MTMDATTIVVGINTVLLSVIGTLATIIYKDFTRRVGRMDRQIIAAIVALLALVTHLEQAPANLTDDLQEALKEK